MAEEKTRASNELACEVELVMRKLYEAGWWGEAEILARIPPKLLVDDGSPMYKIAKSMVFGDDQND